MSLILKKLLIPLRFAEERLAAAFDRRYQNLPFSGFPWSICWTVDSWCQSRCLYCGLSSPSSQASPLDLERAEKEIIRLAPAVLVITGGEPSLKKNLPAALIRIKQALPDCDLILNSNLVTLRQKFYSVLAPHLFSVMVSLDAAGEQNLASRGTDGAIILKNLSRLAALYRNTSVHLAVNSVITAFNYNQIELLTEKVLAIAPQAAFSFSAVSPPDSPYSLFSPGRERELDFFLKTHSALTAHHPGTSFTLSGFSPVSIVCHAQRLQAFMDQHGALHWCSRQKFTHNFHYWFFRDYVKNNFTRDYRHIIQMVIGLRRQKNPYLCFYPCNTSHYLNKLLAIHKELYDFFTLPNPSPIKALAGAYIAVYYQIPHLGNKYIADVGNKAEQIKELTGYFNARGELRPGSVFKVNEITSSRTELFLSAPEEKGFAAPACKVVMIKENGGWKVSQVARNGVMEQLQR